MQSNPEKIFTATERLNHTLPLAQNLNALDKPLQQLYKAVLKSYINLGRSLTREEMARQVDDINSAVTNLQQKDLVLFNENKEPIGAYPFTMEQREHRVTVNGHTVHCMCALDALAVSPMFNLPTEISSRCHVTSEAIAIQQRGSTVHNEAKDIFFGINWSAASADSCCADSLCTEMLFLKNKAVAEKWQEVATEQREIFTISDAIAFASQFFMPLLKN